MSKTIKKLSAMPYAQAHVEINDTTGEINLFSYVTLVASISAEGWLTVYGLYSMTTRKHIGAFMREYVKYPNGDHGTFQEAKRCYEGRYHFNIYTGEVVDWE